MPRPVSLCSEWDFEKFDLEMKAKKVIYQKSVTCDLFKLLRLAERFSFELIKLLAAGLVMTSVLGDVEVCVFVASWLDFVKVGCITLHSPILAKAA